MLIFSLHYPHCTDGRLRNAFRHTIKNVMRIIVEVITQVDGKEKYKLFSVPKRANTVNSQRIRTAQIPSIVSAAGSVE